MRLPDLQDRHGPVTRRINWLLGRGHWEVFARDYDEDGDLEGYGNPQGWWDRLYAWWGYHVRGWPKPPPFEENRVAIHFGFVEGKPGCTDGPVCAEHGWVIRPRDEGE